MIVNQIKIASDRQEELQRISPGFPVSIYQTDFSYLDYQRVNWHWHEDYQLCWVSKGDVLFHIVGQVCQVTAGKGVFINSRLAHTAEPNAPLSSYYCVNFHPNIICPENNEALKEQVLAPFESNNVSPCFVFDNTLPGGSLIIDTLRRIVSLSELKGPLGWELLLQSELLQIWPTILNLAQGNGTRANTQFNQRLQKIITYLNEHYPEKITLQAVSQEAFLCPEECERFFKRITGKTIFRYLMQYRIEKSRELLRNTDITIAEIAQQSGFSSQSYFSVCFQKQTGYTPNQYRKEARTRDATAASPAAPQSFP